MTPIVVPNDLNMRRLLGRGMKIVVEAPSYTPVHWLKGVIAEFPLLAVFQNDPLEYAALLVREGEVA